MSTAGVGSELLANRLFAALVGAGNADLPVIDLTDKTHTIPWDENSAVLQPVEKISIEQLVSYFDALMDGFKPHLAGEHEKGRITTVEYSKTYIALTQGAMQTAVQFALGKDQAFWLAAKTQADAITANTQNEIARIEAVLRRATYALTKLKLATEDSGFGVSETQREELLPAQLALTEQQTELASEQTENSRAQTLDSRSDGALVSGVIGGQKLLTEEQRKMVKEQTEAQRAQTADVRTDGAPVTGLLGVQKSLYNQQIVSYKEDVKTKAAKVFADLWMTQKTMDEGTFASKYFTPPAGPNGATLLDGIFQNMRVSAMGTDDGQ